MRRGREGPGGDHWGQVQALALVQGLLQALVQGLLQALQAVAQVLHQPALVGNLCGFPPQGHRGLPCSGFCSRPSLTLSLSAILSLMSQRPSYCRPAPCAAPHEPPLLPRASPPAPAASAPGGTKAVHVQYTCGTCEHMGRYKSDTDAARLFALRPASSASSYPQRRSSH